jgi:uncharacterized cofD-like protein
MQKIVTIGGGTGQFQILKGLRNYDCEITAISNMSDDGGSSGKLRDEYGILPPGDIKQCMVALAEDSFLRELFNYRFDKGDRHNLGNLILTALISNYKDPVRAIKEVCKHLGVKGKVLPVTTDKVVLCAKTKNGDVLRGESNLDSFSDTDSIKEVFYEPEPFLYKETGKSIREADKIIICSGDLYRSIIPNLMIKGMSEALKDSSAMKIYVCNLFTKRGTYNFKASDFVREIEKYSGIIIDKIILNIQIPSEEVRKKYLEEDSIFVENDLEDDERIVKGDYVDEYPQERKTLFRHIPEKIAREIISL